MVLGEYKSYFDTDTTIIARHCYSEIESATGYNTPLIANEVSRWVITQYGEKEILEITKREFSSPFYDRNWLREQDWDDVEELVPVFHVRDESLIELYSVGEREEVEQAAKAGRNIERPGLFNIVIKTSDGDLGMLPSGEIILFDEMQKE